MDKSIWEEAIGEDANEESVGSYDRCKEVVCSEEGKGVSAVKRRKGGGEEVY